MRDLQALAAQLRAQQNNPLSPMGMAMELQKLENNPAHQQSGQILAWNMQIQQMAAQRDMQIGFEVARAQQANQDLQQRLAMDLQVVKQANEGISQTNARVLPVLKAITGLDLGIDREKWKSWWMRQLNDSPSLGESRTSPTDREDGASTPGRTDPAVGSANSERRRNDTDATTGADPAVSVRPCFAAGTPVQTLAGRKPVESLRPGERVLCQNVTTGALEYQPILSAYRNTSVPTLEIMAGGERILATSLERFWKPGKGWTTARDLKAGDRLRVLGDVIEVASIASIAAQPGYNVDVAGHADLFVGAKGILAHDFSFVPAVAEPFDRYSGLTEPASPAKPQPNRSTSPAGSDDRNARP